MLRQSRDVKRTFFLSLHSSEDFNCFQHIGGVIESPFLHLFRNILDIQLRFTSLQLLRLRLCGAIDARRVAMGGGASKVSGPKLSNLLTGQSKADRRGQHDFIRIWNFHPENPIDGIPINSI